MGEARQTQLDGKAVAITGAGRGIGSACAVEAAMLGASVAVNDIDVEQAEDIARRICEAGGKAIVAEGDISTWQGAEGVVQACVAHFGSIDGLVNNAGVYRMSEIDKWDEQSWRLTVDVNVLGVAFCTVHAMRVMKQQGRGSIVNMSSGAHLGSPNIAAYGASKGAVASLTYCVARELAGTEIRINAVAPRAATRMTEATKAFNTAAALPIVDKAHLTAEQNAPIVCYLLSDMSRQINGRIVRVDGDGISLMRRPEFHPLVTIAGGWTQEALAKAFQNELAAQLET